MSAAQPTGRSNQRFFLASRDNILAALRTQQDTIWYYRFDWDGARAVERHLRRRPRRKPAA